MAYPDQRHREPADPPARAILGRAIQPDPARPAAQQEDRRNTALAAGVDGEEQAKVTFPALADTYRFAPRISGRYTRVPVTGGANVTVSSVLMAARLRLPAASWAAPAGIAAVTVPGPLMPPTLTV
jgi:hypothetical protein